MIFASQEVSNLFGLGLAGALPVSLWGCALFGLGVASWVARQSILGGIYGRAVVAGNQAHAFVGALTILKFALGAGLLWPLGPLLLIYFFWAALFSYLLFWSKGIQQGRH